MFDIGWSEMAVVALIALLVIGPKELPNTLRMVGRWTRKARALTREFRSGFDEMIREAELEDVRKTVESAKSSIIEKSLKDAIDPTGWVDKSLSDVEKAAKADAPSDETASAGETKEANIITHPTKIAPPHSLTPPPPAETPERNISASEPGDKAIASEDPAKSAREA